MEDNITTDHIMPSDSSLLPFRSNIPKLSEYCLTPVDPSFPKRARDAGGGFLLAGYNYGQGSSREHAALVPLTLQIRGVLAKSFARIHRANLINNGILPLTFVDQMDYDRLDLGDDLVLENACAFIQSGSVSIPMLNATKHFTVQTMLPLTEREREILLAGGLINLVNATAKRSANG